MRITSAFIILITILSGYHTYAQTDSTERFSVHGQTTVINQYKPAFHAKYSGINSLQPGKEDQTSITSTLFFGSKLWKGASVFFNPEIAGGSGLSQALGIAAATNGETFRIGDPSPKIYLARLFLTQRFDLSKSGEKQESEINQLAEFVPDRYLSFTIGKVSIADFFDNNQFSHDPRTQFMSWALMSNGAWDYPANTRGYTPAIVAEYVSKQNEFRYGFALVPLTANGNKMNSDISKAGSHVIEYTRHYKWKEKDGAVRALAFYTTCNMGNYREAIAASPNSPDITSVRKYGHNKYGIGVNAEQNFTDDIAGFFRAGWNDGRNETWVFTEIDRSLSGGVVIKGSKWRRAKDQLGIAYALSGISEPHRDYLKAGGNGFILGDGNLNYGPEHLIELNYTIPMANDRLKLTGGYQFLLNPGYNVDRKGPVHVFSVRAHMQI